MSWIDVLKHVAGFGGTTMEIGAKYCIDTARLIGMGANVIAVDNFPLTLQQTTNEHNGGLGADMARMPLQDASVNTVFAANVLGLVWGSGNLQPALDETARVLKTDGHLVATVNFNSPLGSPRSEENKNGLKDYLLQQVQARGLTVKQGDFVTIPDTNLPWDPENEYLLIEAVKK